MSVVDLYTSGFKARNRDHFAAIVRVALSDQVITESEQAFINRLAIYLEIEDEERQQILAHPESYPINPPA
ncbi:MAG: TerB family tellurite resistance protein, partial [Flavobacteriaceae bacterium]